MTREVYARPPLRLVIADLRYPFAPRLGSQEVLQNLTTLLRPIFPIPEAAGVQILMSVGGGGSTQTATQGAPNRFFSRERTTSVTVSPTNMAVETSDYGEYQKFRPVLRTCLETLASVDNLVGVERLGLRYINEIRVPGLSHPREWVEYLAPQYVKTLDVLADKPIALSQSVVQSEPVDEISTVVRFGALRGQVVASVGPLRVAEVPANSPFFLLDFDNSWTSGDAFNEYSVDFVLDLADRLHAPIDDLFEGALTDPLRALLRGQE